MSPRPGGGGRVADLIKEVERIRSEPKARMYARFFKTGPGQYGEGDRFLGLTMPQNRELVRAHYPLAKGEVDRLLKSPWHEFRMMGLLMIVKDFERATDQAGRRKTVRRYLSWRSALNNWDLIDVTAPRVLGAWSVSSGSRAELRRLAASKRHWDRRMAVVSSLALIKAGDLDWVYEVVALRMGDREDLMHKAMGWMLREAGKKDLIRLKRFLRTNVRSLPRTTLRYAIERFPERERQRYLKL